MNEITKDTFTKVITDFVGVKWEPEYNWTSGVYTWEPSRDMFYCGKKIVTVYVTPYFDGDENMHLGLEFEDDTYECFVFEINLKDDLEHEIEKHFQKYHWGHCQMIPLKKQWNNQNFQNSIWVI